MRKIILIILAFSLMQCTGQTEKGVEYPKEKIMTQDRFDIKKFNECLEKKEKDNPMQDLSQCVEILKNGEKISSYETTEDYVMLIDLASPKLFQKYMRYYKNGVLKEETERFIGSSMNSDQIKFGVTKFYDETGRLIKTIDESVRYEQITVKPLQLFDILKKTPLFISLTDEEKAHFKYIFNLTEDKSEVSPQVVHKELKEEFILNPNDRENAKRVFLTLSKDEKKWFVTKDIYPFGLIEFEVDTKSGNISNREYKVEWRP